MTTTNPTADPVSAGLCSGCDPTAPAPLYASCLVCLTAADAAARAVSAVVVPLCPTRSRLRRQGLRTPATAYAREDQPLAFG